MPQAAPPEPELPDWRKRWAWILVFAWLAVAGGAKRPDGELELQVVDAQTSEPLAARVHLRDARKRPVRSRDLGVAAHGDHFYVDGTATLGLRRGTYTFDMDAGWERPTRAGHFEIDRRSQDSKTVDFRRVTDLAREHWHGADLDASRLMIGLGVALRAEQLAYAPLIDWRVERNEWKRVRRSEAATREPPAGAALHAAHYQDDDGALLFYRLDQPIDPQQLPQPGVASLDALAAARDAGYSIVAADATSWRLPIWLAAGVLDGVVVLDRTSGYDRVDESESNGRPRDKSRYPGALGPGRWREAIYFHTLNAGLRLPAMAGSGSGDTDAPLGANRTYAHSPDGSTPSAWWEAALAGRTVVTNGPLLRPNVYGEAPGFVFPLDNDGRFEALIALNLTTRHKVDYLDLIQDGEPIISVSLADWASARGQLPPIEFDQSGWFAVRAVAEDDRCYRVALTGPYYVADPTKPRVSRQSCEFFLAWLDAYQQRTDADNRRQPEIAEAQAFWRQRLAGAGAP